MCVGGVSVGGVGSGGPSGVCRCAGAPVCGVWVFCLLAGPRPRPPCGTFPLWSPVRQFVPLWLCWRCGLLCRLPRSCLRASGQRFRAGCLIRGEVEACLRRLVRHAPSRSGSCREACDPSVSRSWWFATAVGTAVFAFHAALAARWVTTSVVRITRDPGRLGVGLRCFLDVRQPMTYRGEGRVLNSAPWGWCC
ncbi:DUF6207 family protein [Streptomyces coelicoflavus]|uniref:DUF6207 family protein n=1 Tax=Streptomyces coelicoflavus TaxID=285562 RepID=UPI0024ACA9B3|nr:DUF6207 family protein [Streptomyces coelicoflavus]MDI6520184.1 DUF6207 family protein [Streptomyces coelicoflavus]